MFHIGQEVVCIRDNYNAINWKFIPNKPIKGNTYIIRDIVNIKIFNRIGLIFEEIHNPVVNWADVGTMESPFCSTRFRPVIKRKTDISIFNEILNNVGKGKRVKENA